METILLTFMLMALGIQTVLCCVLTVFLLKQMNAKEMQIPSPIMAVKEHKAKKLAKKELDMVETIMTNIDNYDGTDNGQMDVPRG
jgi:hypothetical protein